MQWSPNSICMILVIFCVKDKQRLGHFQEILDIMTISACKLPNDCFYILLCKPKYFFLIITEREKKNNNNNKKKKKKRGVMRYKVNWRFK